MTASSPALTPNTARRERLFNIIRKPHISEKSALAEQANQHILRVATDATKSEIKAAVESIFNVSVRRVQVLNQKGKIRRNRTGIGRQNGWKKAYVSLAPGQQIDFTAGI
ncbi:MAG: 50S ribosomal protein L23 [Cellvibrionales bacterium]|nr:50S ribosomal protein L23 [Cellvibrionales bacterium]